MQLCRFITYEKCSPGQHVEPSSGLAFRREGRKRRRGPDVLGAIPTRAERIERSQHRHEPARAILVVLLLFALHAQRLRCSSETRAATALFISAVGLVRADLASSYFFFCSSVSFMAATPLPERPCPFGRRPWRPWRRPSWRPFARRSDVPSTLAAAPSACRRVRR